MQECLDVGCAPSEEDCAQVGREDYSERARRECRVYISQLRRMFGEEPDGARLSIKSNPHDFGTYWSVVCYFDAGNQAAADYAYRCEGESPQQWDEAARRELAAGSRGKSRKEKAS
jgi:hypothetical protein